MKEQTMEEYVEDRKIARATIRQKVLVQPPLAATKEYRYIPPLPSGLSFTKLDTDTRFERARQSSANKRRKRPQKDPSKTTRGTAKIYKLWDDAQRRDIIIKHDDGATWREIAAQYNTTIGSVRHAARTYQG